MIDKLKNALHGEIPALQQESANIINVFTKTINDLDTVNTKIDHASEIRAAKMAQLAKEQETLLFTKEANNKIKSKLTSILKD